MIRVRIAQRNGFIDHTHAALADDLDDLVAVLGDVLADDAFCFTHLVSITFFRKR